MEEKPTTKTSKPEPFDVEEVAWLTIATKIGESFYMKMAEGNQLVELDISKEALEVQKVELGTWVCNTTYASGDKWGFVVGVGKHGWVWVQYLENLRALGRQSVTCIHCDFRYFNGFDYVIRDDLPPFRGHSELPEDRRGGESNGFFLLMNGHYIPEDADPKTAEYAAVLYPSAKDINRIYRGEQVDYDHEAAVAKSEKGISEIKVK